MRQIEKNMLQAVQGRRNWHRDNTTVTYNPETGVKVFLHGNEIYCKYEGVSRISLAGWNTPTTRSRLRALGADLELKRGQLYLDSMPIDKFGWWSALNE